MPKNTWGQIDICPLQKDASCNSRLKCFDPRQDFPAKQLDGSHHFPVGGAGMLEAQVNHADAALIMQCLSLLHDGVGAPQQAERCSPGRSRLPAPLASIGSKYLRRERGGTASGQRWDAPRAFSGVALPRDRR